MDWEAGVGVPLLEEREPERVLLLLYMVLTLLCLPTGIVSGVLRVCLSQEEQFGFCHDLRTGSGSA